MSGRCPARRTAATCDGSVTTPSPSRAHGRGVRVVPDAQLVASRSTPGLAGEAGQPSRVAPTQCLFWYGFSDVTR
eukprot:6631554-Prymnesium_polylepis.1